MLLLPLKRLLSLYASSLCGGGVVSVELKSCSSRISEEPDAAGEDVSLSLAVPSAFIATKTEAASRSWTCWCFEMSNFEVYCH